MTICKNILFFPLHCRPARHRFSLMALLSSALLIIMAAFPTVQLPVLAAGNGAMLLADSARPYTSHSLVAHAMGEVDGQPSTNSLEAFQASYAKGYRLFECDLAMTRDGKVVLRHDWSAGLQTGIDPEHIPTEEEFCNTPIAGKYTPLTFQDLLSLLTLYPDIYFIIDGKDTDSDSVTAQFTAMVEAGQQWGLLHLFNRLIIQLYSPEMQDTVEAVHHFDHYMLTLYQTPFYGEPDLLRQYVLACQSRGIRDIVMWHFLYSPDLLPVLEGSGIRVWLHTVNSTAKAQEYLEQGAWGIYSDRLEPADVKRY